MGNKSSSNGARDDKGSTVARAFVLKVSMHCQCLGCVRKVPSAVRKLKGVPGVQVVDESTLETTGELRLLATADPERLRSRLHKATRKHVDLVHLLPPKPVPATAPDLPKKEATPPASSG